MYSLVEGEESIRGVIRDCLETDLDLVHNRHSAPIRTVDGCVDYTYQELFVNDSDIKFYAVHKDDLIGFFAIDKDNILRSFHIIPKYRNNGYCSTFWDSVWDVVGESFFAAIWDDNDRAKRFFENEGGELILSQDGAEFYVFKN